VPKLNPNNTWRLVEERFRSESNETIKANLGLVLKHMQAEAQADIERVVATLCESPTYIMHGNEDNAAVNPTGSRDAVRAFYDLTIVQTGAHRLELAVDRVIADETAVFTEGVMRMAYPGRTLQAAGIDVDDADAYYLTESRMGVVWPIDPESGLLTGEEVYNAGDTFAGVADRKIDLADIVELDV
jgi:hypothetical protein